MATYGVHLGRLCRFTRDISDSGVTVAKPLIWTVSLEALQVVAGTDYEVEEVTRTYYSVFQVTISSQPRRTRTVDKTARTVSLNVLQGTGRVSVPRGHRHDVLVGRCAGLHL